MKKRLVAPLIGLVIAFALPTYAQHKDLADPQTTQKILALIEALKTTMPPQWPRFSLATRFLLR